jgi:tRNA A-37 threonylcarbamoyl transferase component Bud32
MADESFLWQPDDVVAGKYRLVRPLGKGGMGIVFEAQHLRLRQRLAIKMLRSDLAMRHDVVLRFEREARAAAHLRSAHVAKVIDVDATPDGVPYIVMEFLEGQSLAGVISTRRALDDPGKSPTTLGSPGRGTGDVHEVVGWVLETCCAIAEAHDLGIVHRDLKPANLFLASDGGRSLVKVLDFGISKLADEEDASLTTTQAFLGTPNYMSPEQVRSAKGVDHRTDIWSLGVILYELLAGRIPFSGTTASAVLAAIVADPAPSLRDARPDVPPELDAIVTKALSKRAEDRFANVRALASALVPFAKIDAYVAAEVAQLLTVRAVASAMESTSGEPEAAAAPTAPGWSRITSAAASTRGFTLVLAAAVLAAVAWFARDALRRNAAPDVAASSNLPSAIAEPPSAVVDRMGAPREVASVVAVADPTTNGLVSGRSGSSPADSDAGSKPPSSPLGARKAHPRPARAAPSDAPSLSSPALSSNPLHL